MKQAANSGDTLVAASVGANWPQFIQPGSRGWSSGLRHRSSSPNERNGDKSVAATGSTHATLLDLLDCGLTYAEARAIPYEEALCLLHVHALRRRLAQLDSEAARLASLPLADPHAVQRELRRVELKAKALVEDFR